MRLRWSSSQTGKRRWRWCRSSKGEGGAAGGERERAERGTGGREERERGGQAQPTYIPSLAKTAYAPLTHTHTHLASPVPPPHHTHRQADDHGHLLTEQDSKLATQADFVLELAGKVDGLGARLQAAQGAADRTGQQLAQVSTAAQCSDVPQT